MTFTYFSPHKRSRREHGKYSIRNFSTTPEAFPIRNGCNIIECVACWLNAIAVARVGTHIRLPLAHLAHDCARDCGGGFD